MIDDKSDGQSTEKSPARAKLAEKQSERILNAAKMCFVDNGLAQTTMRDIAAQADMSLGNIYRYFKNKEALISEFIKIDNQEVGEAFEVLDNAKDPKAMLQQIGAEFIKEIADKSALVLHIDILCEALRNEKVMKIAVLDYGERTLVKSLEKAIKEQRIRLLLPADVAALAIIAFIENAALKCIMNKKYSVRAAQKQFRQYLDLLLEST